SLTDSLTTEIDTLSLHDALPIFAWGIWNQSVPERKKFFYLRNLIQSPRSNKEIKTLTLGGEFLSEVKSVYHKFFRENELLARRRSEEHTSELQSPCNLVCRLLLE